MSKPLPIILILSIVALFLLGVIGFLVINRANNSRAEIPVLAQLPDFEFTERSGQPFGLDQMEGKINVVDFIFTNCQGPCPIMADKMAQLYQRFNDSGKIQFVSISVDPKRDTLAALRAYAERQGVTDDRWVFLRAPLADVVNLSEKGFLLAADSASLPMGHTTAFILVDEQGRIRSYHDGLDDASINVLKENIRQLVKQLR